MMPLTSQCAEPSRQARHSDRAFTLVEIMIGATLGSMILLGVLSSFLMIGRSSQRLFYYNIMETQARRTLEEFAQDVRMASDSTWNNASSLTLTVPDNYTSNGNQVTYYLDTSDNCFYRRPGNSSSGATATRLIQNVTTCTFKRFTVLGGTTTSDTETKRVELTLLVTSTRNTLVAATDNIVSATYLLRNK